jgi:hypothetical protein
MATKLPDDETKNPFARAAAEGLVGPVGESNVQSKRRYCTDEWEPLFLGAIQTGMSVKDAVLHAGVDITTPYRRRAHDPEFRRAWNEAGEVGTRLLEIEAARRAYHGTLKPVFFQGMQCGVIREYSDQLMTVLLKARRPAKYRDFDTVPTPCSISVNIVQVPSGDQGRRELAAAAGTQPLFEIVEAPNANATTGTGVGNSDCAG